MSIDGVPPFVKCTSLSERMATSEYFYTPSAAISPSASSIEISAPRDPLHEHRRCAPFSEMYFVVGRAHLAPCGYGRNARSFSLTSFLPILGVSPRKNARFAFLLAHPTYDEYAVGEVGARVGIADHNYFTKFFKTNAGLAPLRYCKQGVFVD